MRYQYHNLVRSQSEVTELLLMRIGPKVRRWAADHAFTLIFLTVMFFITWCIEIFFD